MNWLASLLLLGITLSGGGLGPPPAPQPPAGFCIGGERFCSDMEAVDGLAPDACLNDGFGVDASAGCDVTDPLAVNGKIAQGSGLRIGQGGTPPGFSGAGTWCARFQTLEDCGARFATGTDAVRFYTQSMGTNNSELRTGNSGNTWRLEINGTQRGTQPARACDQWVEHEMDMVDNRIDKYWIDGTDILAAVTPDTQKDMDADMADMRWPLLSFQGIDLVKFSNGTCTGADNPPNVDAGTAANVIQPASIVLDGLVTDDLSGGCSGATVCTWTVESGPACTGGSFSPSASVEDPTFGPTTDPTCLGSYIFKLTADDGVNAPVSDTTNSVAVTDGLSGPIIAAGLGASATSRIGPSFPVIFDAVTAVSDPDYPDEYTELQNLWCSWNFGGLTGNFRSSPAPLSVPGEPRNTFQGRCFNVARIFDCPLTGADVVYTVTLDVTDGTNTTQQQQNITCIPPLGANSPYTAANAVCVGTTAPPYADCPAAVTNEVQYSDIRVALETEVDAVGGSPSCTGGCPLVFVQAGAWGMTGTFDGDGERAGPGLILGVGPWATYDSPSWSSANRIQHFDAALPTRFPHYFQLEADWALEGISMEDTNSCTSLPTSSCNHLLNSTGCGNTTPGFCDADQTYACSVDNDCLKQTYSPNFASPSNAGSQYAMILKNHTNIANINGALGTAQYTFSMNNESEDPYNPDQRTGGVNWHRSPLSVTQNNLMDRATVTEHGLRASDARYGVIDSNVVINWGDGKSAITVRDAAPVNNDFWAVRNNRIVELTGVTTRAQQPLHCGPQNATSPSEVCSDGIFEANFVYQPVGQDTYWDGITVQGPRVLVERNVIADLSGELTVFVKINERAPGQVPPDNVNVVNNTFWVGGTSQSNSFHSQTDCVVCGITKNNLCGAEATSSCTGTPGVGDKLTGVHADFVNGNTGTKPADWDLSRNVGGRGAAYSDVEKDAHGVDYVDDPGKDEF